MKGIHVESFEESQSDTRADMSMRSWITRSPLGIVAAGFVLLMVGVAIFLPVNQLTQPGAASVDMSIKYRATADMLATLDVPEVAKLKYPRDDGPLTVDFVSQWGLDGEFVPANYRVMSVASNSVKALMAAVIVFCFLRLYAQFAAGRPFAPGNSRLLVVIAGTIVVGTFASGLIEMKASELIYQYFSLELPLYVDTTVPVELLLPVFLLVMAYAFRKGRALTDEVEGLV